MCDLFLVLAQTDEGVTCFALPRVLPDGSRNAGFQLQRLKDKLGNRSNASSEVEFRGALARLVGEPGRGVPTIIEMVNHTRLDCVIGTAAGMRAAVAQATWHAAHRSAFGKRLADQPLMVNVLADLAIESEAATALALRLARAYDEAPADPGADAFKRLATAVAKYHVCKRAPGHAFEALECLGGNGYVEASGMPRLYREAPLASIWEGSGNVMALDVLRALARSPEAFDAFFAEIDEAAGADPRLDDFAAATRAEFSRPRGDRAARPARGRAHGAVPAGLAARAPRPARGGRCLLRRAPGRRRGPALRHAAARRRRGGDRRAPHAAGVEADQIDSCRDDRARGREDHRLRRRAWCQHRFARDRPPPAPAQSVKRPTSSSSSRAVRDSSWAEAAICCVDALVSSAEAETCCTVAEDCSATLATSTMSLET